MHEKITPIQAIRRKCLECSNGQYKEIRDCLIDTCPLYRFRIGEKYLKENNSSSEQISLDYILVDDK